MRIVRWVMLGPPLLLLFAIVAIIMFPILSRKRWTEDFSHAWPVWVNFLNNGWDGG